MLGRGCLIFAVVVLGGGAVAADAADAAARHWSTSQVEKRIVATVPEAQGVHAHIRSWPFAKVAVTGHVDEMGARIDQVTVASLTFTAIDVEVHALKVKTAPLISHGKVVVDRIGNGTIAATVTAAALAKAAGLPVAAGAAGFVLRNSPVTVTVTNRRLVVGIAGVGTQAFSLPSTSLLPCVPSVAFTNQAVVLSCSFDHIPSAFTDQA